MKQSIVLIKEKTLHSCSTFFLCGDIFSKEHIREIGTAVENFKHPQYLGSYQPNNLYSLDLESGTSTSLDPRTLKHYIENKQELVLFLKDGMCCFKTSHRSSVILLLYFDISAQKISYLGSFFVCPCTGSVKENLLSVCKNHFPRTRYLIQPKIIPHGKFAHIIYDEANPEKYHLRWLKKRAIDIDTPRWIQPFFSDLNEFILYELRGNNRCSESLQPKV